MKFRLLIIEDDETLINRWVEKLEFYQVNDDRIFDIVPTYCHNFIKANETIENRIFDAAVIDIRLKDESGVPNSDGNEAFKIITEKTLAVTAVHTGEPLTVELGEYGDFAKVFTKGEEGGDIDDILIWFDSRVEMIRSVQKMNNSIHEEMARLFAKSIWPRWSYWADNQSEVEFRTQSLKRHMATHLHASFLADGVVHPEEYFFIPPLREELDTGDVFKQGNVFYILVTPRCDLAREESHETLQVVKLDDVSEDFNVLNNKIKDLIIASSPERKINSAKTELRKFVNHKSNSSVRHFIPQIRLTDGEVYGPFFARFDGLKSVPKGSGEAENLKLAKVASLSNEFVPSLVERLGSFFSRIGTPDYSHPSDSE